MSKKEFRIGLEKEFQDLKRKKEEKEFNFRKKGGFNEIRADYAEIYYSKLSDARILEIRSNN